MRPIAVLIWLAFAAAAQAQTALDSSFSYQGRLQQNDHPLTGSADLQFTLFDALTDGNALGTQTFTGVAVNQGLFNLVLNAGGEFGANAFHGDKRWLEISVNGTALAPRQELTAAPYAAFAMAPWASSGGNISYSAGKVGIGTSNPQALLHMGGTAGVDGLMFPDGSLQTTAAIGGGGDSIWSKNGVNAYYNAGSVGVGTSTPDGKIQIAGGPSWTSSFWAKALTIGNAGAIELGAGTTSKFGVGNSGGVLYYFQTTANGTEAPTNYYMAVAQNGNVLLGNIGGTAAAAKLEIAASGDGAELLRLSTERPWAFRQAYTGSGAALRLVPTVGLKNFEIAAAGGTNIATFVGDDSNPRVGIGTINPATRLDVLTATGNLGIQHTDGVRRLCTYLDATAGWLGTVSNHPLKFFVNDGGAALSINTNGSVDIGGHDQFSALTVVSALGRGITAQATSSGGVGLTAIAGPEGAGISCAGSFSASGTKSFRIDHPLDPENKFLLHYCSESPEPLNFYSGRITTDAKGEAWVELPPYFESLNKDFRYTLTVIDDSDSATFVQAKVAREIRNNRFKIRTSAGNTKVSWEVKGVRNDLWVRAHGAPVEVEKAKGEKGKYQHPELYAQPPEKCIDFRPDASGEATK